MAEFLKDLTKVTFISVNNQFVKVRLVDPRLVEQAKKEGRAIPEYEVLVSQRVDRYGNTITQKITAAPHTITVSGTTFRALVSRWRNRNRIKVDIKPLNIGVEEAKELFRKDGFKIAGEPGADRANWDERAVAEGWFTVQKEVEQPVSLILPPGTMPTVSTSTILADNPPF